MPVPIAPTAAVAGQAARAGVQFNNLAAQVAFLLDPPSVFAYQGVAQSIANATVFGITLDGELVDTDNVHSLVTNTTRFTIVTPGRYRVFGQVVWGPSATGYRGLRLLKNGTMTVISRVAATPTAALYMQIYDEIVCVAGDYIEMAGEQTSGGTLGTGIGPDSTFLKARWAGIS